MTKLDRYNDLIAWQKAMDLVEAVYRATRDFPAREMYGLTSQVRRAAVSIPSNIAEGQCRNTSRAFLQHLSIAQGSLAEVETQLLIAVRLSYIAPESAGPLLNRAAEVGRLIRGLSVSIGRKLNVDERLATSH